VRTANHAPFSAVALNGTSLCRGVQCSSGWRRISCGLRDRASGYCSFDVFVLRYDDVKTLNVTYLSLHPKPRRGEPPRVPTGRRLDAIEHRTEVEPDTPTGVGAITHELSVFGSR
jgi:hypothetical protein